MTTSRSPKECPQDALSVILEQTRRRYGTPPDPTTPLAPSRASGSPEPPVMICPPFPGNPDPSLIPYVYSPLSLYRSTFLEASLRQWKKQFLEHLDPKKKQVLQQLAATLHFQEPRAEYDKVIREAIKRGLLEMEHPWVVWWVRSTRRDARICRERQQALYLLWRDKKHRHLYLGYSRTAGPGEDP